MSRHLSVKCHLDFGPDVDFYINDSEFRGNVNIEIHLGEPRSLPKPDALHEFGSKEGRDVRKIYGYLQHFPRTTRDDEMVEFIGGDLIMPEEAREEIFFWRHELRFLTLDVAASGYKIVDLDDRSWTYEIPQTNEIIVLGFSYVLRPLGRSADAEVR